MIELKRVLRTLLLLCASITHAHSMQNNPLDDRKKDTSEKKQVLKEEEKIDFIASKLFSSDMDVNNSPKFENLFKNPTKTSPENKKKDLVDINQKYREIMEEAIKPGSWKDIVWDNKNSDKIIGEAKLGSINSQVHILKSLILNLIHKDYNIEIFKKINIKDWYNVKEEIQHQNSLYILGMLYADPKYVKEHFSSSINEFIKANAKKSDPLIQFTIASIFDFGVVDSDKKEEFSQKYYYLSAKGKFPEGLRAFADTLFKQNDDLQISMCMGPYKMAAEAGSPWAQFNLGKLCFEGRSDVVQVDKKLSFKYLMESAERGFKPSQEFIFDKFLSLKYRNIKTQNDNQYEYFLNIFKSGIHKYCLLLKDCISTLCEETKNDKLNNLISSLDTTINQLSPLTGTDGFLNRAGFMVDYVEPKNEEVSSLLEPQKNNSIDYPLVYYKSLKFFCFGKENIKFADTLCNQINNNIPSIIDILNMEGNPNVKENKKNTMKFASKYIGLVLDNINMLLEQTVSSRNKKFLETYSFLKE